MLLLEVVVLEALQTLLNLAAVAGLGVIEVAHLLV
jgi:hypothetical protein